MSSAALKVISFHSLDRSLDLPDFAYAETEAILTTLKRSDLLTYEHCLRVGKYAYHLAKAAGLSPEQQLIAQFSGFLHDVGKMGISSEIIHKPAKLTEDEYRLVKSHPLLSVKMISHLEGVPFFDHVIPAVKYHHERYDGLGYPEKLVGEDIPFIARLVLVVDTLDAMTADRPYRKGLPIEAVYDELKKYSGTQFDPNLVKIFLESHKFWGRSEHTKEAQELIIKKAA